MSESKVKDGKYILIQSFMVKELNLKGNELLIYAIIYGFSQDEETKFSGSLKYLADWTNSTKQGVIKCLKSLESNSLIHKLEIIKNGVKFCEYYATKFNTPMQQSLIGGIKQSLPNNISLDNIDNNIDTYKIEKLPLEAKKENKEIKNKEIPTLKEFGEFALSKQSDFDLPIDKKKVKLKYDAWFENGWKDGNDKKITNWKSKLINSLQYLLTDQKETKPETSLRSKAL